MPRATVAAVIPTKNVAGFVRGTLDSLWFCDEVIVVDMFSTDDTAKVCGEYPNVRFFRRNDFIYGNFNYGLDQATADWVIRLDSDERLSPALQDEIVALLGATPDCDYYDAPFVSYLCGHPIHHGMAWEQPVRKTLFRRGTLRYKVRSEHEDLTPAVDRPLRRGLLRHPYHHFSTPDISTFWRKLDYYTDKDYERADLSGWRRTPVWRLLLSVARGFFRQYVRERGYRDGFAGFILCAMNQMNRLLYEFKGWERQGRLREHHVAVRDAFDAAVRAHAEAGRAARSGGPR
jgi:glycosyltransferase involved in cell wall biosynthesis